MTKMSESCDELELGCYGLKIFKNRLDCTGNSRTVSDSKMSKLNVCKPVALRDIVRFVDSGPSGPRIPEIQV